MDKTKLTALLKSLRKEEIEKFSMFLKSPLYNERETLSALFEEIRLYHPGFDDPAFTKENLFRKLYKDRKYNDESMRNLFSRLYKLLETYLSFLYYEKDGFYRNFGLLKELNDRGHEKLFKKKFKEIKEHLNEEEITDIDSLYRKHQMAFLNRYHLDAFRYARMIENDATVNDALKERETKLVEYFLADIMNVYSIMINQTQMNPDKKYTLSMVKFIRDYMETNYKSFKDNFYLQIYFNLLMLLTEPDQIYYDKLKVLLKKHSNNLSPGEKSKFYTLMHNYIQDRIFEGNEKAIQDKYELYIESFENGGMYNSTGTINNQGLISAVNYSLIVNDFSQASKFLNKYIGEVEHYYRESTCNYCLAIINYYKSDYENALKHLAKVNYDDLSYKVLVKTLSLMTYFSMNEIEGFYSYVDSFRHFLAENKQITDMYKNFYLNFISFTSKLFKSKEDPEKFDITGFMHELKKTNNVAKKHWLLEQIYEIENKKLQHK